MKQVAVTMALLAIVLTALNPSCATAEGSPANHHGTERGASMVHPADHACENSKLTHGDIVEITEGTFTGLHAKVLEKSPSGRHHCHVLVAFIDAHIDVLSVIGVFEIELLAVVNP